MAWSIGRKGVTSVIIGGRAEEQFRDNLASADLKLTKEERTKLDEITASRGCNIRTGTSAIRQMIA